jgi:uncharacterized protein
MSLSTPIIKPVDGTCNLSCSYCYTAGLSQYTDSNDMSIETLKSTVDFFCQEQDKIEFIWHGGEPLLAGLEFYRKVLEFQSVWEQKGKRIVNFIQTNATLITPEWVNLFANHNFFVGVSLDGPRESHDRARHYSSSRGSFEDVMRGINLLRQDTGTFNGAICSVGASNSTSPRELFDFFIVNNIKKLKFGRVKNIGHCNSSVISAISYSEYTDFMIAIFDLWLEYDDPEIEIRNIQTVVNLIFGGKQRECIYMGKCDQFVTVYSDGSIYSCDSFPKTPAFYFGSVSNEMSEVNSSPQLIRFRSSLNKHREHCESCEWSFVCRGGCAKDNYAHIDDIEPLNDVCENLKRYFSHISDKLKLCNLTS